ncbi:hypothetical protein [Paenirhodobacter sp. CAU 1674]|uniref:hypothetical protein n=1 Tax=Paenirhodobacter sp. CAU 1674 TaxID=3032596 RepID=UPI0023DB63B3|nr:hypothetical protein [Paenirhodobacter sp. CAU 1674]MDF2141225.1 hypothetical protein [Paenirhodobacter sp. CAU 1674]
MAKSKLANLDEHLFAALERLSDEDLSSEQIEIEVKRSGAIVEIADQVTENARVKLAAAKLFAEHGEAVLPHLPQIGQVKE